MMRRSSKTLVVEAKVIRIAIPKAMKITHIHTRSGSVVSSTIKARSKRRVRVEVPEGTATTNIRRMRLNKSGVKANQEAIEASREVSSVAIDSRAKTIGVTILVSHETAEVGREGEGITEGVTLGVVTRGEEATRGREGRMKGTSRMVLSINSLSHHWASSMLKR
jgi:hypothetical protein